MIDSVERRNHGPMSEVENRAASLAPLEVVQDRVPWLATSVVHHANSVREQVA
jgi:hypothetical protein